MGIIELKNDRVKIGVNTHGAELVSLVGVDNDREYMWCGDPAYWGRVSPVLFPFVGKLEGQKYIYKETLYENIPQHGFARDSEFVVEEQTADTVWLEMIKDEKWAVSYPFDFKLRIGYRLEGANVHVMWTVVNTGTEALYFSIGAHPAFACDETVEGYSLDMHTNAAEISCGVLTENGVLGEKTVTHKLGNGVLKLTNQMFDEDALIMDGSGINTVTLRDRNNTPVLQLRFDTPQLGIWSPAKKYAPFICIEPWFGRCDREGYAGTLEEREYGNSLDAGHSFNKEYVIEIL